MKIRNKNEKEKKTKTISFAYDDGYEALEWLEFQSQGRPRGASGYLIELLLKDKNNNK